MSSDGRSVSQQPLTQIRGRVWKFGDNINTDLMMPNIAYLQKPEDQPKYVFWASRPGWSSQVQPGDIIIGGKNFGTGSSRPAAKLLRALGIAAVVAEDINGLFLRNAVNFGLPAFACPGVAELFAEGDEAEIDFPNATIRHVPSSTVLQGRKLPPQLVELCAMGGMIEMLRREGYLEEIVDESTSEVE